MEDIIRHAEVPLLEESRSCSPVLLLLEFIPRACCSTGHTSLPPKKDGNRVLISEKKAFFEGKEKEREKTREINKAISGFWGLSSR
jgi:hypothetical protein